MALRSHPKRCRCRKWYAKLLARWASSDDAHQAAALANLKRPWSLVTVKETRRARIWSVTSHDLSTQLTKHIKKYGVFQTTLSAPTPIATVMVDGVLTLVKLTINRIWLWQRLSIERAQRADYERHARFIWTPARVGVYINVAVPTMTKAVILDRNHRRFGYLKPVQSGCHRGGCRWGASGGSNPVKHVVNAIATARLYGCWWLLVPTILVRRTTEQLLPEAPQQPVERQH